MQQVPIHRRPLSLTQLLTSNFNAKMDSPKACLRSFLRLSFSLLAFTSTALCLLYASYWCAQNTITWVLWHGVDLDIKAFSATLSIAGLKY